MIVYMFTGLVVIPKCTINRGTVRFVGTQVLPPYHGFLHMCAHPSYDYKHVVSCQVSPTLLT